MHVLTVVTHRGGFVLSLGIHPKAWAVCVRWMERFRAQTSCRILRWRLVEIQPRVRATCDSAGVYHHQQDQALSQGTTVASRTPLAVGSSDGKEGRGGGGGSRGTLFFY